MISDRIFLIPVILIFMAIFLTPALAVEHTVSDLEQLDELLKDMMDEIDEEERKLLDKVEETGADAGDGKPDANKSGYRVVAQTNTQPPEQVGDEQRAGRQQAEKGAIPDLPRISPEIGGVLTPRNRLVLEPSFRYAHSSVSRVSVEGLTILPALLIGVIDIVESDRDTYSVALAARYGITNTLEVALNVPYMSREDSTRTRRFLNEASQESTISGSGSGLGDIEIGMRYQFNNGGDWPFMVGNLRVKSRTGTDPFELATKASLAGDVQLDSELPTGSGFWSANPSVTFIYPSDPVVFFGNIGYLWTFEYDKGTYIEFEDGEPVTKGFGNVDPGDAIRLNFGMGLGLNDRASLSFSYSLDSFSKTYIENSATQKIVGSDVTIGRFIVGFSLRTKKGLPLNLAIGIGATDDAPDSDLSFRVPINFFN